MPELLLELFSEEIPARLQLRGSQDLKRLVVEALTEAGLETGTASPYSAPRRLVLHIDTVSTISPAISQERKGPRVGAPEKALEGFMRGAGISDIGEAEIITDPKKGDFYVVRTEQPGRPAEEIISEILPEIIRKFPWAKSMRWGTGRLRWVRPLHCIVCLFDGKPIPFEIDGLTAGRSTFGHRFMAKGEIKITDFENYQAQLHDAKVLLNPEKRRNAILEQATAIAKKAKLQLVDDQALLAETAGLVDWPVVLLGTFDKAFLNVPAEVITSSLKTHQKCFSLKNPKSGQLTNKFLLVSNIEAADGGQAVIQGNERVVQARLADAQFFWQRDLATPLAQMAAKLDAVTFHEKLGTQAERVERLKTLARELAPMVGADPDKTERAAQLCKADLVTDMVGEFPELQGLMGRYYALDQGEDASVAAAIEEHYRPQGPSDAVPSDPVSIAVALADKLDMLVGFWAIDEKPTGSKDPYALRRAALGVIRIILENNIRLELSNFLGRALQGYLGQDNEAVRKGYKSWTSSGETLMETIEISWDAYHVSGLSAFFKERLKFQLRRDGARHDLIDAVISPEADDLLMIVKRVDALATFLDSDDGANLLAGIKRAQNILRIEEKKDGITYNAAVDKNLLSQQEEKTLHSTIQKAVKSSSKSITNEDFSSAMAAIAGLRQPVDAFFDAVTVNADDPDVRANRLKLLAMIRTATAQVADFSKIAG